MDSERSEFSKFTCGSDPIRIPVRMSVIYISSLSFDARKKIISALDRVISCQDFCVPDFLIFV